MLQRFGAMASAREVKFAPVDLKHVEPDGTFHGYAACLARRIWRAIW